MTARRTLLLLAAGALAGCGQDDVPAMLAPLPAAPAAPPPAGRLRTVAQWTAEFERSWRHQGETGLPMSRSTDSRDHYDLSYSVDACVAMFRATGERRYLDRAVRFVSNVAASAVPSRSLAGSTFRDDYLGWPSAKSGQDGNEVPLYESYFWRYGTALLAAMHDAGLRTAEYRRLLAFAEVHVFDKWFGRGADQTVYRERTHMAAHWALIAVHLARITADPARRDRCLEVSATIDRRLRDQMRRNPVEPTAYFWNDRWGSAARPGQDVGHGNGVVAYVVENPTWTATDLAAFAALLTRVVWPAGQTYRGYVDGSGTDNGWYADGFVKLGRTDPAVQLRLDQHRVVNDQFAANMALNARMLRAGQGRQR